MHVNGGLYMTKQHYGAYAGDYDGPIPNPYEGMRIERRNTNNQTNKTNNTDLTDMLDTLDVDHSSIIPERPSPLTFFAQMLHRITSRLIPTHRPRRTDLIVRASIDHESGDVQVEQSIVTHYKQK